MEDDAVTDAIWEIVDGCIPIYNSELLSVAQSNLRLACVTPEALSVDADLNPCKLIACNIFDALYEEVNVRYMANK